MNTIIIHPFNRVKSTPMHDMSAALIAPVSKWYHKSTPWWIDGFEEVSLQPIVETDEIAEDVIEEDDLDENEQNEDVALADVMMPTQQGMADDDYTQLGVAFENQGDKEGEQNCLGEPDVFQVMAREGTPRCDFMTLALTAGAV